MKKGDMPVGLGMALAQNPDAMQKFAKLGEDKQKEIIDGTHSIRSKSEMRNYVDKIASEY